MKSGIIVTIKRQLGKGEYPSPFQLAGTTKFDFMPKSRYCNAPVKILY